MADRIAFHGDPAIKAKYLARVEAHREADELVQGHGYWDGGRGCAVGCTIHGFRHSDYEAELGIPEWLAHLEDVIFEELPPGIARAWPSRFLGAIRPGSDLSPVLHRFLHWLLTDDRIGLARIAGEAGGAAIAAVARLHERAIAGENPPAWQWSGAATAASELVWSVADSGEAAAAGAVQAADWSAGNAAEAAADAAAAAAGAVQAAAWSAAGSDWSAGNAAEAATWVLMADELIGMLGSAPAAGE